MSKIAYSVREVAERLGISDTNTVLKAIKSGDLEASNIGGKKRPTWRITPKAIEEFLTKRTHRVTERSRERSKLPPVPEYV